MNEQYFIIKITNSQGKSGYITEIKGKDLMIAHDVTSDIKQFKTKLLAGSYIQFRRLKRYGKVQILSNLELVEEAKGTQGVTELDKDMFYLEDSSGRKLFYSAANDGYYFEIGEAGYCVWNTEADAERFIQEMEFPITPLVKKLSSNIV